MTYDDLHIIQRADVTGVNDLYPEMLMEDLVYEQIIAVDLRREAIAYLQGNELDILDYLKALDASGQPIEVLYFPDSGRAGIASGGPADWTDADSAEDALERYFEVDGKCMVD